MLWTWKNVTVKLNMTLSTLSVLLSLVCVLSSDTATIYKHITSVIRSQTKSCVYLKGKNFYERRRKVKNGLCKYIFPEIVVARKSTLDVSQIIKMARDFEVWISVGVVVTASIAKVSNQVWNEKSSFVVIIDIIISIRSWTCPIKYTNIFSAQTTWTFIRQQSAHKLPSLISKYSWILLSLPSQ